MRKPKYSFKQWCLDNDRQDLLDRWDYERNDFGPSDVAYKSEKEIWFKCPDDKHDSELQRIDNLANGRNKTLYCRKCRSFAQHFIDKYGEALLCQVWSEMNDVSPWEITYSCKKDLYFNCLNDESHVFKRCTNVYLNKTNKCPICEKISHSYAVAHSDSLKYWSDLNEKTPFDYSAQSYDYVYWKCKNGIHDDYQRGIRTAVINNFECPKCNSVVDGSSSHNIIDLTNRIFGELVVVKYLPGINPNNTNAYWLCHCSCGNDVIGMAKLLHDGHNVTCGDKKIHYAGDKNPNWKGGSTSKRIILRNNTDYKQWRASVYAKDYYTCQCCGVRSGFLNAHHIKDFASYEELRYDVENGITLCPSCHDVRYDGSLHNTYGCVGVTPEELEKYINERRKELGILIPFSLESYRKGNVIKPDTLQKIMEIYSGWPFMATKIDSSLSLMQNNFVKIFPRYRIRHD